MSRNGLIFLIATVCAILLGIGLYVGIKISNGTGSAYELSARWCLRNDSDEVRCDNADGWDTFFKEHPSQVGRWRNPDCDVKPC